MCIDDEVKQWVEPCRRSGLAGGLKIEVLYGHFSQWELFACVDYATWFRNSESSIILSAKITNNSYKKLSVDRITNG